MKKQKLISAINHEDFNNAVNQSLADGWFIIPESLRASVSIAGNGGKDYGGTYFQTARSFVVVLERDEQ